MKIGRIILATGAVAALAIAAIGSGCSRHRGCDYASDPDETRSKVVKHLNKALDRLDATQLQRERVLEIATPLIDDVITEARNHRTVRTTLRDAWMSESMDVAALQANIDTEARDLTALSHRIVSATAEIHSVLTPTQRAEIAEHMGDGHGRSHHWFR